MSSIYSIIKSKLDNRRFPRGNFLSRKGLVQLETIDKTKKYRMSLKGFSLVEIIVVLFIFLLILGAIFGLMSVGRKSWYIGNTQVQVQQEARRAVEKMAKELRQSATSKVDISADDLWHNTVTFQVAQGLDGAGAIQWSDSIQYSLNNGQVIRNSTDGEAPVLANNALSLGFRRPSTAPNIIQINVETSKNAVLVGQTLTWSLTSQVRLRN
jgi:prepilin-type N-terminal cleavage/methylation domain-containing protein